jgi:hypothetical protein
MQVGGLATKPLYVEYMLIVHKLFPATEHTLYKYDYDNV